MIYDRFLHVCWTVESAHATVARQTRRSRKGKLSTRKGGKGGPTPQQKRGTLAQGQAAASARYRETLADSVTGNAPKKRTKSLNKDAVRKREWRAAKEAQRLETQVQTLQEQLTESKKRENQLQVDVRAAEQAADWANTHLQHADENVEWLCEQIKQMKAKLKAEHKAEPAIRLANGQFNPEFDMVLGQCIVDGLRTAKAVQISQAVLSFALQRQVGLEELPSERHARRILQTMGTLGKAVAFEQIRSVLLIENPRVVV